MAQYKEEATISNILRSGSVCIMCFKRPPPGPIKLVLKKCPEFEDIFTWISELKVPNGQLRLCIACSKQLKDIQAYKNKMKEQCDNNLKEKYTGGGNGVRFFDIDTNSPRWACLHCPDKHYAHLSEIFVHFADVHRTSSYIDNQENGGPSFENDEHRGDGNELNSRRQSADIGPSLNTNGLVRKRRASARVVEIICGRKKAESVVQDTRFREITEFVDGPNAAFEKGVKRVRNEAGVFRYTKVQYECNFCSYRCPTVIGIKSHVATKGYSCNICRETLCTLQQLAVHRRTHGKRQASASMSESDTADEEAACDCCKIVFANSSSLRQHRRSKGNVCHAAPEGLEDSQCLCADNKHARLPPRSTQKPLTIGKRRASTAMSGTTAEATCVCCKKVYANIFNLHRHRRNNGDVCHAAPEGLEDPQCLCADNKFAPKLPPRSTQKPLTIGKRRASTAMSGTTAEATCVCCKKVYANIFNLHRHRRYKGNVCHAAPQGLEDPPCLCADNKFARKPPPPRRSSLDIARAVLVSRRRATVHFEDMPSVIDEDTNASVNEHGPQTGMTSKPQNGGVDKNGTEPTNEDAIEEDRMSEASTVVLDIESEPLEEVKLEEDQSTLERLENEHLRAVPPAMVVIHAMDLPSVSPTNVFNNVRISSVGSVATFESTADSHNEVRRQPMASVDQMWAVVQQMQQQMLQQITSLSQKMDSLKK